jgi:tetratricopeptide (TPR) repeat protein
MQQAVESCVAGHCAVALELRRLADVYDAGAFEATIFYAARLLEALATEALQRAGLPPAGIVLSNLDTLQQFDLVTPAARAWAHSLRRLGNDVRHLLRSVSSEDAQLAMIFAERWLDWFFCSFPLGDRLPSLTLDGAPLFRSSIAALRQFVVRCDQPGIDPTELANDLLASGEGLLRCSPAPAAVVVERLIARQKHDLAQRLLAASRKWSSEDPRLCQLQGLLWSRTGQLDAALAILEPLNLRLPHDPETSGILAGVYKRLSDNADDAMRWLWMAHQAYERGWKSSRNSSAYLGINAATMSLWLGRGEESRALAAEVRDLLRSRIARLSGKMPDAAARMSYWDRVTLAESELLLGEFDGARREYLAAFAAYPEERDNIAVSTAQATQILTRMGASEQVAHFWQPPA